MSLAKKYTEFVSGSTSIHEYLVAKCKEGDARAQRELYALYVKAMYNICRRIVGDEDDAKDVLQESFIDAFSKINSLTNDALFSAWLKKIVVNKSINSLRKRRPETMELVGEIDITDSAQDDDFVTFEAKRILKAIDKISDGCRTVLSLYLFEGYDHSEIGAILGITESTSKAQYSKAKMKIREVLASGKV